MKLADLAQNTHQQRLAQIGPPAWAELHSWGERFMAQVGDACGCGEFAQRMVSFDHDLVSVRLGKQPFDRENFLALAQIVREAAEQVYNGVEPSVTGSSSSRAENRTQDGLLRHPNPQQPEGLIARNGNASDGSLLVSPILQESQGPQRNAKPIGGHTRRLITGATGTPSVKNVEAKNTRGMLPTRTRLASKTLNEAGPTPINIVSSGSDEGQKRMGFLPRSQKPNGSPLNPPISTDALIAGRKSLLPRSTSSLSEQAVELSERTLSQLVSPAIARRVPGLPPSRFNSFFSDKPRPLCTPAQRARLERCIQRVKEKGGAANPWAVCQASLGCRKGPSRMSASLLEYLLHSAAGAGAATAAATLVSRALGAGSLAVTSPEAVIRVVDDRERQSKPRVHNPKTVEGDQAEVDLGTLLSEIDAILTTPGKMGEVDPQTLQVVREGA